MTPEARKKIGTSIAYLREVCDRALTGKVTVKQFVAFASTKLEEIRSLISYTDSDGDISPNAIQNLHAPSENEAPEDFDWEG